MDYKWYVVCSSSGCEQKVCAELNKLSASNECIKEAFIPTKKGFKILKGKKVEAEQKLFPCYVFVNMVANHNTLEVVRNIPKVFGFLGSKFKPEVVSDEKVKKLKENMLNMLPENEITFEVGDAVKITEGPFESFTGIVDNKDDEKKILKLSISIFGRATSIDIDYSKVEKV